MFSTSVAERLGIKSLSGRLAVMFAVLTIVTLGAVGACLYGSLASLVREQDDEALVTFIEAARLRLRAIQSVEALRRDPGSLRALVAQRHNLILILRSASGENLLEVRSEAGPLPQVTPVPDGTPVTVDTFGDWRLDDGRLSRAGSAFGHLGNSGEPIEIIAALAAGERAALLGIYRVRIFGWIFTGALISVLLSWFLIRTGLKPVHDIAGKAAAITVNRLQTRLDAQSAPRELQELVTALNAMLDRIEDGFQRLTQFSADVAHDLRTPITNLIGQTQVALTKTRSVEDYQSLLASNVEEFERLARMVENMLFLARADNAQVALQREKFDARVELNRIADYFHGMAEESGVAIRSNGGSNGAGKDARNGAEQFELSADPILFRRAVHNLLANAIRYTPPGGEIDLASDRKGGDVMVSVKNPGPGIEPEHLPHLFDRFYRTDRARSDSATSAGLGLAIVQSIARLHGGRVEVESRVGGTTVFRLLFPAARV